MTDLGILLAVNAVYLVVVLVIGMVAYRRTTRTSEDYFLGGRTARTVVLFMALFGTNVTPFVLMGIPGLAYHNGVGVFGHNAAIVALGIPASFFLIGYPAWIAARAVGAITPAELYRIRLDSRAVGLTLFAAYCLYTLPYLVTSVLGVGVAVSTLTGDAVGFEVAAAFILVITLLYTTAGGMRATMWTNVFQGAVFLVFVVVAFFAIADGLGGFSRATAQVAEIAPELLQRAGHPMFETGPWASWGLAISLTVIAFPHMFVRIFAARDVTALKNACRLYPLALAFLWIPAVMIGVWGAAAHPGMVGKASDAIFPTMIQTHLGPVMQAIGLAGILAAVMSTIDAQFLTLSSMLTRDVMRPRGRTEPDHSPDARADERRDRWEVAAGRLFMVGLSVVVYLLVLAKPASIFAIASFSFSGYVVLVPTLYLGLRWRRFTAAGAIASIGVGTAVLVAMFLVPTPPFGILPVAWALAAAIVTAVGVSRVTAAPPPEIVDAALGPVERVLGSLGSFRRPRYGAVDDR